MSAPLIPGRPTLSAFAWTPLLATLTRSVTLAAAAAAPASAAAATTSAIALLLT